ncbi:hypothetical protein, partial [Glycomyces tenuis]
MEAVYRWRFEGAARAWLTLETRPLGEWDFPLPRLGLRMAVPKALEQITWFGGGPGEAYADTRA